MGFLGSALTKEESAIFEAQYNIRAERRCLTCGRNFISPGAHIRKCPVCKAKEKNNENNQIRFDMHVYKTYGTFKRMHAFRGEIE